MKQLVRMPLFLLLAACLAFPVHAQQLPAAEGKSIQPQPSPLPHTLAVCGEPTCSCGTARLIAQEYAPCRVTSATGDCASGTGQCCVCQASKTIAICAEPSCDCGNSQLLMQVHAPCQASSTTGQCSIGTGQCCVCAVD